MENLCDGRLVLFLGELLGVEEEIVGPGCQGVTCVKGGLVVTPLSLDRVYSSEEFRTVWRNQGNEPLDLLRVG